MMSFEVAIVVLNWNGWRDTITCLESLTSSVLRGLARVYVVDNASTDESAAKICAWLGQSGLAFVATREGEDPAGVYPVTFIQAAHNGGYASGNNLGIRSALNTQGVRYVFVLNNDATIEPDCIEELLRFSDRNPQVGVVGCTLLTGGSVPAVAGGSTYNPLLTRSRTTLAESDSHQEIDFVCGAAQFISTDSLRRVGILNEQYFLYFEELDLTRRMRAAGYSIAWCPSARVRHRVGSSAGSRSDARSSKSALAEYHSNLSCLIFTRTFYPRLFWYAAGLRFVLKLGHVFAHRNLALVQALLSAYRDYFSMDRTAAT